MPLFGNNSSSTGTDHGQPQHDASPQLDRSYPLIIQTGPANSTRDSRGEAEYNGPRGPTHPYSLYPQTTAPIEDSTGGQHIPVGFTGMGATYQRQMGPDGEEGGDLIGSDGHVEELPPYTRYPDQAYMRRARVSEEETEQATPSSPAAISPQPDSSISTEPPRIPGAGGIGIATRNPEFSSTEENLPVEYDPSSRSADMSASDITVITRDFAEKLPTGKWQRRARKKFLGVIPYWAICLLIVGLAVVGIVMGAVLGILLTDDDAKKPDGDE